ncbi:MAG: glycosyltransferase family 39 protein [Bryobacteraceae bacterium]|nr:glycosyltransferase family 39 protein [Bryobacteraceae bacterium]
MNPRSGKAYPLLFAALLCALGWIFIPRLGIEADEALVGGAIYPGAHPAFSLHVGRWEIPLMLSSYLGAGKAWILNGVFWLFPPSPVSLRVPTLLLGAFTVWMFWRFLDATTGRRAAIIGTALLATDTTFVLTEVIDWGPVAIQQACKLGGLLLLLRFHKSGSRGALFGGFLVFGLGLWDKALFAWALAGLAAAAVVVHAAVRRHLTWRNVSIATAGLALGALPLIVYNVARPLETLTQNAAIGGDDVLIKIHLLQETLNGRAFHGFLVAAAPGPKRGSARSVVQRVSERLSSGDEPVANWNVLALVFGTLAVIATRRRAGWFALLFLVVTWGAMAATARAGGGAHHVVLLWPFPMMLTAVAIDAIAPRRWIAAAMCAMLCAGNLLALNQYAAMLIRNGGSTRWTDAMTPLARRLEALHAKQVFVTDWGILESVHLLTEGRVALREGAEAEISPEYVYAGHTAEARIVPREPDVAARAKAAGFSPVFHEIIHDRQGRATFVIYRFAR